MLHYFVISFRDHPGEYYDGDKDNDKEDGFSDIWIVNI